MRHGPRIALTPDGHELLKLARPLVEGIDQLEQAFAAHQGSPYRGTVNIAAGGSTIQYILPRFVESFMQEHPQVDLRLHNVTGKAGLVLLREGDVDFAVGPMLDSPPDIQFHPVVTHEPMLIMRRDHPLAKRQRIAPEGHQQVSTHLATQEPEYLPLCRYGIYQPLARLRCQARSGGLRRN